MPRNAPANATALTSPASCVLALVALLFAAANADAAGMRDPLRAHERAFACSTALDTMRAEPGADVASCLPRRAAERAARKAWELLLVERREPPKSADAATREQRLANVYFYDYGRNVTHLFVVDVGRGRALRKEKFRDSQLPLTTAEVARAKSLAVAHRRLAVSIAEQYLHATGRLLPTFDAIEVKAFAFHGSTLGERATRALRRCGRQRCAQLSLFVDGLALDLQPVVNLSSGRVHPLSLPAHSEHSR